MNKAVVFPVSAAVIIIAVVFWLMALLAHDQQACKDAGGNLHIKSAGKGISEWCITPDGRVLY